VDSGCAESRDCRFGWRRLLSKRCLATGGRPGARLFQAFDVGGMRQGAQRMGFISGPTSKCPGSAGPLQTFSDGLLEDGLVADTGLLGDLLRLFEVGDWDAN
jgi:hypothetical protein